MKTLLTTIALTALLAASAQATEIAVVDAQKIMLNSLAAKSIHEQINAKQREYDKAVNAMPHTTKEEREAAAKAKDDNSNHLSHAYSQAFVQVQSVVTDILTDIADKRHLDYIVPSNQMMFYRPELSITDEVIAKLDEKLPNVQVGE